MNSLAIVVFPQKRRTKQQQQTPNLVADEDIK